MKSSLDLMKHQILHKMKHFSPSYFRNLIIKGGLAFLVITIIWEIVEDVLFPLLFWALGRWIHPAFYAGIPISWALCLHWFAVPLMWGYWMKRNGKDKENS